MVDLLCRGLVEAGHSVKVVCKTPSALSDTRPYEVIRNPSPLQLLRLVQWSQIFFQANVSLRGLWPLALVPRPWVVAHHSWYRRPNGSIAWQDRLKRVLLRFATGIAVSRAVAQDLSVPSIVIGNCYDDAVFRPLAGVARTRELIFVGRLVSDKGVPDLIGALGLLAQRGQRPRLTIVGAGPEETRIRHEIRAAGLEDQVELVGTKAGHELAALLNAHQILVVPSRYNEPFGIVALEGIACGCVVVGSSGGGLNEAIGPCGVTYPNGDVSLLASRLESVLRDPRSLERYRQVAARHLVRYSRRHVVGEYLRVLEPLVDKGGAAGALQ